MYIRSFFGLQTNGVVDRLVADNLVRTDVNETYGFCSRDEAVMTVVTCSFTVSCSISSYVCCAITGLADRAHNRSAPRLLIVLIHIVLLQFIL